MKQSRSTGYGALIVLTLFLALTAFAGGIGLVTGLNAPPRDYLSGSMFASFVIPGLSLFVLVGGAALAAAVSLMRRRTFALPLAAMAGIAIMFFEFVEILVIGSPAGIARDLQIFYFGLGTLIAVFALVLDFLNLRRGVG